MAHLSRVVLAIDDVLGAARAVLAPVGMELDQFIPVVQWASCQYWDMGLARVEDISRSASCTGLVAVVVGHVDTPPKVGVVPRVANPEIPEQGRVLEDQRRQLEMLAVEHTPVSDNVHWRLSTSDQRNGVVLIPESGIYMDAHWSNDGQRTAPLAGTYVTDLAFFVYFVSRCGCIVV